MSEIEQTQPEPQPQSFSRLDIGVLIVLVAMAIAGVVGLIAVLDAEQRHRGRRCRLRRRVRHLPRGRDDRVRAGLPGTPPARGVVARCTRRVRARCRPARPRDLARHRQRGVRQARRDRLRRDDLRADRPRAEPRVPAAGLARSNPLPRRRRRLAPRRGARAALVLTTGGDDLGPTVGHRSRFALADGNLLRPLAATLVVLAALWFAALAASRVERPVDG